MIRAALKQIFADNHNGGARGADIFLRAGTDRAWRLLREVVPAYEQDRWLAPDIAAAAQLLKDTALPNVH